MIAKDDIVEVVKIDAGKRTEFNKYLFRQFKVRQIGSPMWRHNIELELVNLEPGLDNLMDKFFLESHGWNKEELRVII